MLNEPNSSSEAEQSKSNFLPIMVTGLIGAWIIGMAILGAGWLIANQISKQSLSGHVNSNQQLDTSIVIDLKIPSELSRLGNSDAKVTVVEFADFQCPYCGQWHKQIYPKLKSEYIDTGKVQFVFWDLAFLGEESFFASEAAMCAKDQNRFWDYHNLLFDNQDKESAFSIKNLKLYAKELGLESQSFDTCVDNRKYKDLITQFGARAEEYHVNSTPTVFINGQKFEGVLPWENYKTLIEEKLNE